MDWEGRTLLDILPESVFRRYDAFLGDCLLCRYLFETVFQVAVQYGLDLQLMTARLETSISKGFCLNELL